jgi:hypothetical protein
MASKLTAADSSGPARQSDVTSKVVRDNTTNHKNKINELIDEIAAAAIGTTNAETTAARPYNTNLKERLDQIESTQYRICTGGVVSINAGDSQKVDVTAGTGTINGIEVNWSAATSGTIAYTSSDTRYDVVVINTDNTASIVTGTEDADPLLPSVASTQRAIWVLLVGTASVALAWDARDQGCLFWDGGHRKYQWQIQDAINDITSGTIYIGKGTYIEEADLSGTEDIELLYDNGALHYRPDDSSYCIKNINTAGAQKNGTKITGGQLFGNSKTGAIELLKFQYANQFVIDGTYFDGNTSSTATDKNYVIDNCQNGFVRTIEDGINDHNISNSIKINEVEIYDTAGAYSIDASSVTADSINVDTIDEKTTDNGVVIEGVTAIDSSIYSVKDTWSTASLADGASEDRVITVESGGSNSGLFIVMAHASKAGASGQASGAWFVMPLDPTVELLGFEMAVSESLAQIDIVTNNDNNSFKIRVTNNTGVSRSFDCSCAVIKITKISQ